MLVSSTASTSSYNQARNQGVHGVRSHPLPPQQAPKVRILILNIQVKECSQLNWSFKLNSDI